MNYSVSDFIIRLKNAVLARRNEIIFAYSSVAKAIGNVLVKEGFLTDIKEEERDGKKVLIGHVNYIKRMAQFTDVRVISKPSLRIYARKKKVFEAGRGLGMTIVSTNKGIMSGREAISKGLGGELLFRIW